MAGSKLNDEQKKAVEFKTGPLLIIAGAGTGKTTVITERIKHLIIHQKVSPRNILALTFTEKAAKEMQERIDIALPYGYTEMWIHTFHAFCDRILRKEAIHVGLNPAYKLQTEAQSILFLKKHLFELQLSYFLPLGNPDKFLSGLLQHFSRLKDEDIAPEKYTDYAEKLQKENTIMQDEKDLTKELANAYKIYEDIKKKEGVMDFSDLIANTLFVLRKRESILRKYQEQFQYVLVDEFQDTNYSQNQLAVLLAGENRNISVVGDDDQSIYRWRGAAISNMMLFKKNFPKAKIVTLTKNYRSTQSILDTGYTVIQNNNPNRLEIKEKIDKHLVSSRKEKGEQVHVLIQRNGEEEAETVVKKIQELFQTKKYGYQDFAILIRANDHAQPFIRTLQRFGIPHQFLGPEQLFLREEIKDLIAFLKVLYNPQDDTSLYRVLTMNIFAIPVNDISFLLQKSRKLHKNLIQIVKINDEELSEEGKTGITKLTTLLTKLQENIVKDTAGKILYDFFVDSGLMQRLLTVKTREDEQKAQNIAKFFERLKLFENQSADASVFSVVDWLDLSMQLGESPLSAEADWTEHDAVNILTIHSSKGLEFPVVFVVNLVTQRFPSRERGEQIPIPESLIKEILPTGDYHLQEERRLFYVAITRARDLLFLTSALSYSEAKRERKISPFLIEAVGNEIIVTAKQKLEKLVRPILPEYDVKALPKDSITMKDKQIKVTYLSYSQIQTFDTCPLHYKLKYILKLPTEPNSALSFGTSLHALFREYYLKALQGEKMQSTEIPELLQKYWISEGYKNAAHETLALESAIKITERYIAKNFDEKNLPLGVEVPFTFNLGKLKIGGRIDRVDKKPDGNIEIIDYKSGRNVISEQNLKNNLQLTLYALAATKIKDNMFGRKPEQITLSLHYVETDTIITTTRTQKQLEDAEKILLAKAEEIERSDFFCSRSMFCEHCEYSIFCSTFR